MISIWDMGYRILDLGFRIGISSGICTIQSVINSPKKKSQIRIPKSQFQRSPPYEGGELRKNHPADEAPAPCFVRRRASTLHHEPSHIPNPKSQIRKPTLLLRILLTMKLRFRYTGFCGGTFDLGVHLTAEKNRDACNIEPEHENYHTAQ